MLQPPSPLRVPTPAASAPHSADAAYVVSLPGGPSAQAILRVDTTAGGAKIYRVALWQADRDEPERYSFSPAPAAEGAVPRLGSVHLFFTELWEPLLAEVGAQRKFLLTLSRKSGPEEVTIERLADEGMNRRYQLQGPLSRWELTTDGARLMEMRGAHGVTILRQRLPETKETTP